LVLEPGEGQEGAVVYEEEFNFGRGVGGGKVWLSQQGEEVQSRGCEYFWFDQWEGIDLSYRAFVHGGFVIVAQLKGRQPH